MSSHDLTRLDMALAEAFIVSMQRLLDDGKSVAAYALLDRALPIAILVYDAVKSHRLPAVAWLLRFPEDRAKLPQRYLSVSELGRSGWAGLPDWDKTVNARFYCDGDESNYTLSRLGMWAEDPVHGGSLNRVPLNVWADEAQVTGPCHALREITKVLNLGAGDCSIMETAYSEWKCLSERTCVVPPPEGIDPDAPPGSATSPLTVLATFRAEVEQNNCAAQRLAFRPDRGCLSTLVADTGYLLSSDPGSLKQCVIDAIGDPSPIRFLSNYEGIQSCTDPYGEEGADDPPASDSDGSSDEDEDVTNEEEIKKARRIAASEVSRRAEEMGRAAREAAGRDGFKENGENTYLGASDFVSTQLREGKIPIIDRDFSADSTKEIDFLGHCPPPCTGGPGTKIEIDSGRIEETAFELLGEPGGTVETCRADVICRDKLDNKIAVELARVIAHEAAHIVHERAKSQGAFTDAGIKNLERINRRENEDACTLKRKRCSSAHEVIYGAGFGQCTPEMPCASELCAHPDSTVARLLECSPVDPSEFQDPRCWYEDPCVSYEPVVQECVSGNNPIVPDPCTVVLCGPDIAENLLGEGGCCSVEAMGQLPSICEALPPSCDNACCWDCAACPAFSYLDEQAAPIECLCESVVVVE